jgi:Fe-S oxidoreductase
MARRTIEVLEGSRGDYIVTGGTSCAIAMLHDYAHLFRNEPVWQTRAERLASRVMDFTTFMHRVAGLPAGSLVSRHAQSATYHYFCQSYNVLGFRQEPLQLLGGTCGLKLMPLPEANVCCGFGGSVSLQRPEACELILERKLANVAQTGVDLLITDNPGCIMHLRGGLAASGSRVRVHHTAEVVAEALRALA